MRSRVSPEEYEEFVGGKPADVFAGVCMQHCPNEGGFPSPAACETDVCPWLWTCVAEPSGLAGPWDKLMECLSTLEERAPEGQTEAAEAIGSEMTSPAEEPSEDKGIDAEWYMQNVEGRTADVVFPVCMMKCPAETGEPTVEQCEQHLCPFIMTCLMNANGEAGPVTQLETCLHQLRTMEGDDDGVGEDETLEVEAEMAPKKKRKEKRAARKAARKAERKASRAARKASRPAATAEPYMPAMPESYSMPQPAYPAMPASYEEPYYSEPAYHHPEPYYEEYPAAAPYYSEPAYHHPEPYYEEYPA